MRKIETLSSIEGRKTLIELFKELRYEKRLSSLASLFLAWKICVGGRDLRKYSNKEINVIHPLGFFSGTGLWMQEVVNRFYFSTINSFVYFGAAILLAIIGIRRFSESVSESMVIAGVAFEAFLLIIMFVVMLFSPNDEALEKTDDEESEGEDLLSEIGEIGRDIAEAVNKLENVNGSINEMIRQQVNLLNQINQIAKSTGEAVSPNPQMLDSMRETNASLAEFKNTVDNLNDSINELKSEEIESAVRKEVERLFVNRFNKND